MADTKRGDFPELICSDCGRKGCSFVHFGDLVPEGEVGNFCFACWLARDTDFGETGVVKPLGTLWRLVPKEFADKEIKVKTESGSTYILRAPMRGNKFQYRTVLRENNELPFNAAAILLLRIGKSMCLNTYRGDISERLWITSPVVSIE